MSFATSIETTIITTSLPAITQHIGGQEQFVWIANSYAIAATIDEPLVSRLSDIFGRRMPMLISVALFAVGSAIAGAANGIGMLIAGRLIQGLGAGGVFVLLDIITCDLVPVRERSQYMGIILSTAVCATIARPVIGGALARTNWRWVFWINLPISAAAFIAMVFVLDVKQVDSFAAGLLDFLCATLVDGRGYAYVGSGMIQELSGDLQELVVELMTQSLKTVWQVGIAFALLAVLLVFAERHVELRSELETEFGMNEKNKTQNPVVTLQAARGVGENEIVVEKA